MKKEQVVKYLSEYLPADQPIHVHLSLGELNTQLLSIREVSLPKFLDLGLSSNVMRKQTIRNEHLEVNVTKGLFRIYDLGVGWSI